MDAIVQRAGIASEERLRLSRAIRTYTAGLTSVAASGTGGRPLHAIGPAGDGRAASRASGGPVLDADADLEYSIELMIAGIASLANRRR